MSGDKFNFDDLGKICSDEDHEYTIEKIDGVYMAGSDIGFTNVVEICKKCRLIRQFLPENEKVHDLDGDF